MVTSTGALVVWHLATGTWQQQYRAPHVWLKAGVAREAIVVFDLGAILVLLPMLYHTYSCACSTVVLPADSRHALFDTPNPLFQGRRMLSKTRDG